MMEAIEYLMSQRRTLSVSKRDGFEDSENSR